MKIVKLHFNNVCLITFLSTCCLQLVTSQDSRERKATFDSEQVMRYVLQDYYKLSPPKDSNQNIILVISSGLLSIDALVENQESFSFTAWLSLVWYDRRLSWSPEAPPLFHGNHGANTEEMTSADDDTHDLRQRWQNISLLIMPLESIWVPTVFVTNSVTGFEDLRKSEGHVLVERDGTVTWVVGDRFDVHCNIDTYKFPFDTQQCFAEFTTDTVLYGETKLVVSSSFVNTSECRLNAEYELQEASLKNFDERRVVRLTISFTRRWMFYIFNSFLPVFFFSILNTLVFLLPATNGERVSFSVSLLMSYAIVISAITDTLPPNSVSVCLFSVYMATLTLLSSVCAAANIAVIAVHSARTGCHGEGECIARNVTDQLPRRRRLNKGCRQNYGCADHLKSKLVYSCCKKSACNTSKTQQRILMAALRRMEQLTLPEYKRNSCSSLQRNHHDSCFFTNSEAQTRRTTRTDRMLFFVLFGFTIFLHVLFLTLMIV